MNTKLFNLSLIKYEFRNLMGNIFTMIFGVFFPIGMTLFFGTAMVGKVPESMKDIFITNIFITDSLIIPLATILIGYAAVFSQELEKNIPLRFRLFGYSEKTALMSKICANLIFITLSLILYTVVVCSVLKVQIPALSSALILIGSLYLLSTFLFILAHGIALFFKKFGPTNSITMSLYFAIMVLSGMFGVQSKDFPDGVKAVAYTLPTTYISGEFIDFWKAGSYNFVPYIQSFIFFAAVSCIILFLSIHHNSRRVK
ncbi:ABC transporter permease [Clostridium sp. CM028]|uniref:ABC transporter permease n=1 Tax=Clostridium sp. CM028 TaxID=2851575 RepID=UPI001C6E85C8|nr:ABC transporter permease [Clostridium sp. CM028]MBW9150237.1 ABC transporter permease [Clostridium sp. CM028]WLC63469.1 ABC transporter permease [Clostridium sp. CM028]